MADIKSFKTIALSFPGSIEMPHFEKTSFRANKKIFATLDQQHKVGCVKLNEIDQSVFCAIDKLLIYPVKNKWGKNGWTLIDLTRIDKRLLKEILATAFNAINKKPTKMKKGTKENPWELKTPPGSSEYTMYTDESVNPPILVCTVGKTILHYKFDCLAQLHTMLKQHGDWMELGSADEQKPAKPGTVEEWGRSPENPNGGWYGLKKGFRGRFGMYIPPLMELLGMAELEHNPKNNRMRAK
ncbi:MAG: MmcQ/YjbR family DNA-binding protein [Ferruginibacter sp.]